MRFGALLVAFVGAAAAIIALLSDPLRGLFAGALPVLFGLIVWMLTNWASYQHRSPDTLAEERPHTGKTAPATHPEGDPFDAPQPPRSPAEHAEMTAGAKRKSGRSRRKKSDAA